MFYITPFKREENRMEIKDLKLNGYYRLYCDAWRCPKVGKVIHIRPAQVGPNHICSSYEFSVYVENSAVAGTIEGCHQGLTLYDTDTYVKQIVPISHDEFLKAKNHALDSFVKQVQELADRLKALKE
jgi:hypothetical protein